jgi:kynurenine formamidase
MAKRWTQRPEGSNWGDFGQDDQLGRINLLTPDKRLEGAAEIKIGRAFCLSLPLDYPGGRALAPHRFPPEFRATQRNGRPFFNYRLGEEGAYCDCGCDDAVLLSTQYSTQWDSLAHIGALFDVDGDGVDELAYYNGFVAEIDVVAPADRKGSPGTKLGIETMAAACVQGRGVLIDLHAHFARERRLVGYDDLLRIIAADNVVIEPGDMLCLHTGFAQLLLEMNRAPDPARLTSCCAVLDGVDEKLLRWITDSQISALIADNYAVEAIPSRAPQRGRRAFVPLHVHCLFRLGLPLGELWYLTELAAWLRANRRSRFFLTAPPLRLPGAVGSPLTPIATV